MYCVISDHSAPEPRSPAWVFWSAALCTMWSVITQHLGSDQERITNSKFPLSFTNFGHFLLNRYLYQKPPNHLDSVRPSSWDFSRTLFVHFWFSETSISCHCWLGVLSLSFTIFQYFLKFHWILQNNLLLSQWLASTYSGFLHKSPEAHLDTLQSSSIDQPGPTWWSLLAGQTGQAPPAPAAQVAAAEQPPPPR